jgi:hypothetical protein
MFMNFIRREEVGRPKLRWMDGIKDDVRMLSVRGWRRRVGKICWKRLGPKLGCRTISSSSSSSIREEI